jgi:hypothetical protein
MVWYAYLATAALVYFILVFLISRIVIPFLGFDRHPLPKTVPRIILNQITAVKKRSSDKESFIIESFKVFGGKYSPKVGDVFLRVFQHFKSDISHLWGVNGYLGCHQQSHLFRIFLVKSGYFKDRDIHLVTSFHLFMIHRHLRVRTDSFVADIDPYFRRLSFSFAK